MTEVINVKSHFLEEILEKSGRYHYFQTALIFISICAVVWPNLNFVFIAGDVNYRCKVPECEALDQPYMPDWWPDEEIDHCSRPILNSTVYDSSNTCTNQSFTQDVEKCTEWVYETNDTVVAELNLACQLWKQNMIGTVHGFGMMFPVLFSGWIADRFGRKFTLIICLVGYIIGYFKLLASSYNIYLVIECLEAAFSGGVLASGSILLIENTPKKTRMLVGVLLEIAFNLGESLFACLGMVTKNWRTLVSIIYSPCILFLSYILLVKESPRWNILHGNVAEAKKTLRLMAKMNKVNINFQELEKMDDAKLKELFNLEKEVKKEGLKEAFACREMWKRFAMGFVTRFTVAFVYYSLQMNSVYLPGNKYTNFLYGALSSCPGVILSLFLMNKFGRKLPMIYGFIVFGLLSIILELIEDDYVWLKITMFLFSKMVTSGCFSGMVIYTMEVYPTSVRGSMVGLCMLASNMGSMMAPLVPSLVAISPVLMPMFYGCSTLLSTFLLCFSPETNNLPLPDTIKQISNHSRVKKSTKLSKKKVQAHNNLGFENDFVSHF